MRVQQLFPTGVFWDVLLSNLNARKRLGYYPNIKNPTTFNEYILAQKLHFVGDLNTARRISDKYEVKSWLSEVGFPNLVVPTIGVFSSIEAIRDFKYHGEVIAKPCHGSGSTMIRTADKGNAFTDDDFKVFGSWLREDYYTRSREPNYRGLKRRIIIEPMLRDGHGVPPKDFKVFCADGVPFAVQVDHGRFSQHTRQLYTTNWTLLNYSMCYPLNPTPIKKPTLLEPALNAARHLSSGFGFVRVDFYFMPEGLKLGEMTFFPGNGAERFDPDKGDFALGTLVGNAIAKSGD